MVCKAVFSAASGNAGRAWDAATHKSIGMKSAVQRCWMSSSDFHFFQYGAAMLKFPAVIRGCL